MTVASGSGIRAFIALSLPEGLRRSLHDLQNRLKPDLGEARWMRSDAIHLTVKFLGDTPADVLDRIGARFPKWISGIEKYTLNPMDMGVFPNFSRPRVLWVGFEKIPTAHHQIVEVLEAELALMGFAREKRSHTPHLTLARFKGRPGYTDLETVCRSHTLNLPALPVSQITLYRSDLSPAGAKHTELFTASLSESQGG